MTIIPKTINYKNLVIRYIKRKCIVNHLNTANFGQNSMLFLLEVVKKIRATDKEVSRT